VCTVSRDSRPLECCLLWSCTRQRQWGFSGALWATTIFILITDTDDIFPNEDFFPDISNLYVNIGDNSGIPNIKANANMGSCMSPCSCSSILCFSFLY
jgi:hypothetical protein